jgi:hypothetical protein
MGDRILLQCHSSKTGEFGPVAYGHWCGSAGPGIVAQLAIQMKNRPGDVQYSSARLVEIMCSPDPGGDLSVGIWNTDRLLREDDSHGDAGVVLIDVDNGHSPTYMGGYLPGGE